jgi:hypothetical protein
VGEPCRQAEVVLFPFALLPLPFSIGYSLGVKLISGTSNNIEQSMSNER